MRRRRFIPAISGAVPGFLIGGFAHLWFINDVGYGAIIAAGQSGSGWNTKSVGDGIGAGTILYLLGLLLVGFCVVAALIAVLIGLLRYRGAIPFRRIGSDAGLLACAAFFLGALGAVAMNQRAITENYTATAALGEWFESGTIAVALPAMQSFSANCQRALLVPLLLTLIAWGGTHWHRARRNVRVDVGTPGRDAR